MALITRKHGARPQHLNVDFLSKNKNHDYNTCASIHTECRVNIWTSTNLHHVCYVAVARPPTLPYPTRVLQLLTPATVMFLDAVRPASTEPRLHRPRVPATCLPVDVIHTGTTAGESLFLVPPFETPRVHVVIATHLSRVVVRRVATATRWLTLASGH